MGLACPSVASAIFCTTRSERTTCSRPRLESSSRLRRPTSMRRFIRCRIPQTTLCSTNTADGVRRSIEDSLQRLGVDSLDVAFVHDISPDFAFFPNGWEEQYEIARKGAFPALSKMRDEGII